MFLNVVFDLLFGNRAHRRTEIATAPQMLSPIPLLEVGKFILQFARRYPLQILHDFRRTQLWWAGQQQMNMISAHMAFQYHHLPAHTDLPHDLAGSFRYLAPQHFLAVFGRPYKVILDVIGRM
jgi:hypothetical protein